MSNNSSLTINMGGLYCEGRKRGQSRGPPHSRTAEAAPAVPLAPSPKVGLHFPWPEQAALNPRNWSCWWLSQGWLGRLWGGKEVALEVTNGLLHTVTVVEAVGGAVTKGLPAAASPP